MAEHDWKQLLDDPEVRRIVEMVHSVTPRNRDPYLDDDRISYLWDRAIDAALKYNLNPDAEEPLDLWRGYLWMALKDAAIHQRHYTYGPKDSPKRLGERARWSFESVLETEGEHCLADAHGEADDTHLSIGEQDTHERIGNQRLSRADPLYAILALERYERALERQSTRETDIVATPRSSTGLCADPACWSPATTAGLCGKHYSRHLDRWGSKRAPACSNAACERPAQSRGLCGKHYKAWMRNNPDAPRCLDCDRAAISNDRCTYHAKKYRERTVA